MINYGKYLIQKGVICTPCYWNLIFGNIAGFQPNLIEISAAVSAVPGDHFIALAGLGVYQNMMNSLSVVLGYGVRTGLEDNIWRDKSKNLKTNNIELVRCIHSLIDLNQAEFMTAREFGEKGFYNTSTN